MVETIIFCFSIEKQRKHLKKNRTGGKVQEYEHTMYILGVAPSPVTVTTRIITYLVGDSNLNLHLPLESWDGATPNVYPFWVDLI